MLDDGSATRPGRLCDAGLRPCSRQACDLAGVVGGRAWRGPRDCDGWVWGKPHGNGHLSLPPAGCHPSRVPIFMSVPGTGPGIWEDPLDFSAPLSPRHSPRLPPLTLFEPPSQVFQRSRPEQCQKWHARQTRTIVPGGGRDFQLSTLDFRLYSMARPPIAPPHSGWAEDLIAP